MLEICPSPVALRLITNLVSPLCRPRLVGMWHHGRIEQGGRLNRVFFAEQGARQELPGFVKLLFLQLSVRRNHESASSVLHQNFYAGDRIFYMTDESNSLTSASVRLSTLVKNPFDPVGTGQDTAVEGSPGSGLPSV